MTRSAIRLPLRFDAGLLRRDLANVHANAWITHFNTAYHERLTPEPFPSCPGFASAGEYLKLEGDVPIGNSPCSTGIVVSVDGNQACRNSVPDRAEPFRTIIG